MVAELTRVLLRPHVTSYLETKNKMLLGERTVVIMSTTVGQKSYGEYDEAARAVTTQSLTNRPR